MNEQEIICQLMLTITNNIDAKSKEELIQNTHSLTDLICKSSFKKALLLNNINRYENHLVEEQLRHEIEMNNYQEQLLAKDQLIKNNHNYITEISDKSTHLNQRLIQLEEELQRQQAINYILNQQYEEPSIFNYRTQTKELSQQVEALSVEICQLNNKIDRLNEANQKMKQQNTNLLSEIEQLNWCNSQQELQNKQLKQIQAQNIGLIKTLREEGQRLISEQIKPTPESALKENINTQNVSPQFPRRLHTHTYSDMKEYDVHQFTILEHELQNAISIQTFNERNVYNDFFTLLTQCAKLNSLNFDKVIHIKTAHLYDQFLRFLGAQRNASHRVNTQSDSEDVSKRNNTQDYVPVHNPLPKISKRVSTERSSVQKQFTFQSEDEEKYPFSFSPKIQPQRAKKSKSDWEHSPLNQIVSPTRLITASKHKRIMLSSVEKKFNHRDFMHKYDLTTDEWDKFGNRFPQNFKRDKLLGRGGFSLIWLGSSIISGQRFAIKQLPRKSKHETHIKELNFCNYFFQKGGILKMQFQSFQGSKALCKMFDFSMDNHDIFIFYEVCGVSLGSLLYDFQLINSNTIYKLVPQQLSLLFKLQPRALLVFIKRMTEIVELLSRSGWVHSDIKSENILVTMQDADFDIKLIDYGSSFRFQSVFEQFSMATPEYMCPELLTFILKENKMSYDASLLIYLENYTQPWVIDMWALGCIILEIVSGIPLWMSFDTQVVNSKGQKLITQGLFAVKGRSFAKIVEKQIKIVQNLESILQQCNFSGIHVNQQIINLLKGMLQVNPKLRISPQQILDSLDNY